MSEKIKPVTFVNEEISTDKDLNSIFIEPFLYKHQTDVYKAKILDQFKYGNNIIDSDRDLWLSYRPTQEYIGSRNYVVRNYIIMNSLDLYISNAIQFYDSYLSKYKINVPFISDSIQFPAFLFDKDAVYARDMISNSSSYTYTAAIYLLQYMDMVYSAITNLYNTWITSIIEKLYYAGKLETVYKDLYQLVYNEKASKTDIGMMYTFISSTYRELIVNELEKIKTGLAYINQTALNMLKDDFDFVTSIGNKDPLFALTDNTQRRLEEDNDNGND